MLFFVCGAPGRRALQHGFWNRSNIELAKIRRRVKEAYIRQEYELGQRLEYDFGEVRLDCGEGMKTYHMAVFCSASSNFRWLYLYKNQKKEVFFDSHVQFFEMMGGCYREIVYDNMKNVVKKFIGRTEKELTPDLIKMSLYYGFKLLSRKRKRLGRKKRRLSQESAFRGHIPIFEP